MILELPALQFGLRANEAVGIAVAESRKRPFVLYPPVRFLCADAADRLDAKEHVDRRPALMQDRGLTVDALVQLVRPCERRSFLLLPGQIEVALGERVRQAASAGC